MLQPDAPSASGHTRTVFGPILPSGALLQAAGAGELVGHLAGDQNLAGIFLDPAPTGDDPARDQCIFAAAIDTGVEHRPHEGHGFAIENR
jgi:hypothetical protein